MAINRSPVMTVEDYFEWELQQERKHEYIDGVVYEMPGVSDKHDAITVNIMYPSRELSRPFARFNLHTCRTATVQISLEPLCLPRPQHCKRGRPMPMLLTRSEYNLINPCVVLEVTSPSSIDRDRQEKLEYYFEVPSIEACLIVDQHRVCAELYTRGNAGWQRQAFTEMDDVISLAMLDCELPLDQVYLGIAFEEN